MVWHSSRSIEWRSRHKDLYTNRCLKAFLHQFMANSSSETEACACALGSILAEIYKKEQGIHSVCFSSVSVKL